MVGTSKARITSNKCSNWLSKGAAQWKTKRLIKIRKQTTTLREHFSEQRKNLQAWGDRVTYSLYAGPFCVRVHVKANTPSHIDDPLGGTRGRTCLEVFTERPLGVPSRLWLAGFKIPQSRSEPGHWLSNEDCAFPSMYTMHHVLTSFLQLFFSPPLSALCLWTYHWRCSTELSKPAGFSRNGVTLVECTTSYEWMRPLWFLLLALKLC